MPWPGKHKFYSLPQLCSSPFCVPVYPPPDPLCPEKDHPVQMLQKKSPGKSIPSRISTAAVSRSAPITSGKNTHGSTCPFPQFYATPCLSRIFKHRNHSHPSGNRRRPSVHYRFVRPGRKQLACHSIFTPPRGACNAHALLTGT